MQLHLVYDQNTIDAANPDGLVREHAYEKIFLHELGHAACEHAHHMLDVATTSPNQPAHVLPRHELEAFVYAFAVRGMVLGMRSRLNRLLKQSDDTWRMQ
jgi:hypothetical protein